MEKLSLHEAAKEFSNDYNLGEYLRHTYQGSLNSTTEEYELVREFPNNYELGAAARSIALHS